MPNLRELGPFPAMQIVAPAPDDSDLVSVPVKQNADGSVAPLTFHGGATIKAIKVVALYSGRFWGDRAKNDTFLKSIVEDGYLDAGMNTGFGRGTFLGSFDIPAPPSGDIIDTDCQAMIAAAIGKAGIPAADEQTLFLLILPDGVKVSFDAARTQSSCSNFCGYHSSTPQFIYAVHPAATCNGCNQGNPQDGLQMVESHEIAETASDPRGQGWYNDQTGMENGDEAAWIAQQFNGYTVQGYAALVGGKWFNAVGAYMPNAPTPQPKPKPKPRNPLADQILRYVQSDANWIVDEENADYTAAVNELAHLYKEIGSRLDWLKAQETPA